MEASSLEAPADDSRGRLGVVASTSLPRRYCLGWRSINQALGCCSIPICG
jgi:hypothetical protein